MSKLTSGILGQIAPHLPAAQREIFLPHLNAALAEFGITTKLRISAFLGQTLEESGEFTIWSENLHYSAGRLLTLWPHRFTPESARTIAAAGPEAIANHIYGGRFGNTQPGDGWRYRGRCPMQLTFRNNYRDAGKALGIPLEENPDLALEPEVGFRIAAYFFKLAGCNQLADRRAFKQITKVLNGAYFNLDKRVMYYERALRVIPDGFILDAPEKQPVESVHQPEDVTVPDHFDEPRPSSMGFAATTTAATTTAPDADVPAVTGTPEAETQKAETPAPKGEETVTVQKVAQSLGSKVMSGGIPTGGAFSAFMLAVWGVLKNPYVIGAIIIIAFLVGAWLWDRSKERQARTQNKLIEKAADKQSNTVVIEPPPAKAG